MDLLLLALQVVVDLALLLSAAADAVAALLTRLARRFDAGTSRVVFGGREL